MTIEIKVTNPAEHQPSELRAVALFLNNLAADREAGRIAGAHVVTHGTTLLAAGPTGEIPKGDAPSASSEQPPAADADEESNTSSADLDSKGVRYDARIHSANRSRNADDSWRMKRGVDEALVKQVLAEQATAEEPVALVPEQADDTPPPVVEEEQAPTVPVEETPPPVVEETKPAAAAVLPAEVIKFVTGNKIPMDQAKVIYEQFGLANAGEMFKQPELCGDILEAMRSLVAE
mgnify:CR=1 FL=1